MFYDFTLRPCDVSNICVLLENAIVCLLRGIFLRLCRTLVAGLGTASALKEVTRFPAFVGEVAERFS